VAEEKIPNSLTLIRFAINLEMKTNDWAIRTENLSKRYRIEARQAGYRTLREAFIDTLAAPLSAVRWAWKQGADSGHDPGNNLIWALKDICLEVRRGDILGIIGPNGGGKSTLLKVLSRITEPTSGRAELRGRVGSLLEVGTGFHPELTGRENIFLNGAILGMTRSEIQQKFDEIVEFAELGKFIDTPLKRYSSGMGTRLAFSVAAHLEPEILLVDEVLAVGDLGFRKKCLGKMWDVSQEGRTILFVSHEMNAIRRLCQKAVWLNAGKVQAQGEVQEVVAQYEACFLSQGATLACRVERDHPSPPLKYFFWASLATARGEATNVFNFGETLRLTLGMTGSIPHKTHYVEWYLIEGSQGSRVAWGTTHALPDGDIPADAAEISFIIGPLPLAEGQYYFSLALGVAGVTNFDFWYEAITFEVIGSDPEGTGYHYLAKYAPSIIPYHVEIS
jgi:lipopolysaccharide transport system ATP-binding protein